MCLTLNMFGYMLTIVVVITLQHNDVMTMMSELNGLSELPLDKLLQMKNSMDREIESEESNDEEVISASLDTAAAQALHGKMKMPYQRGSYETSWQKKGGKKGLSTIFQISITALAFLAFGGYLLCLLVQAIKSKQTTTTTTTTANGGMVVMTSPLRRRRPGYRHRRQVIWPETDPDSLYYALRMFSEGYTTYNTVDYKYFNFTVDSLG